MQISHGFEIVFGIAFFLLIIGPRLLKHRGAFKVRYQEIALWICVVLMWSGTKVILEIYNQANNQVPSSLPEDLRPSIPEFAIYKTPRPEPRRLAAPYFGNLRERCVELSRELLAFVTYRREKMREIERDAIQTGKMYDRMRTWSGSTTSMFRNQFMERLLKLQQELAEFHIDDERMSQILKSEQQTIARERSHPVLLMKEGSWTHLGDVEELSNRLQIVSEKLKP